MDFSNMSVNVNSGKPPIAQQPVAGQMRGAGATPVPQLNLNQVSANTNINATNSIRLTNAKQPTVSQTARPSSRGAVNVRGAASKKPDKPGHRLEDFGLPQSARMALPSDNPIIPSSFELQFPSDTHTPILATIPPDIIAAMASATDEDRPSTRRSRLRSRGGTEYLASVEANNNPNPTPQTAIGPLEVNADGTIAVESNAVPTQVVYAQAPAAQQRSNVDGGGRKGKHINENQTQGSMNALNPRDMALRNKQMANGTIGANGVYR